MKLRGKTLILGLVAAAFILSGVFGPTVSEASYFHHGGGQSHHDRDNSGYHC